MITLFLEELHGLVQNRFFSEVVDAKDYFDTTIYLNGIDEFVATACFLEEF